MNAEDSTRAGVCVCSDNPYRVPIEALYATRQNEGHIAARFGDNETPAWKVHMAYLDGELETNAVEVIPGRTGYIVRHLWRPPAPECLSFCLTCRQPYGEICSGFVELRRIA